MGSRFATLDINDNQISMDWLENETRLKLLLAEPDGAFLLPPYDRIDWTYPVFELPFYAAAEVMTVKTGRNKMRHIRVNRAKTKLIYFI